MVEAQSCELCRRRGDAVGVALRSFCVPCLAAIGRFVCEGPAAPVESLWRARPRELARRALSDLVEDEVAKIRQVAPGDDAAVESAIAAFKGSFAATPLATEDRREDFDPIAQLDLALGYRQMGLTDEALFEAARALSAAERLGSRAHEAAAIVINPACLRLEVEETLVRLRAILFPG